MIFYFLIMKKELIYCYMNDDDLLRISRAITECEKKTSGEISVCIKGKKTFGFRKQNIKEMAEKEFFRSGLEKTRDKTGILIFLLLKEKQFYILADSGINEKVHAHSWDKIKNEMQEMFGRGEFSRGIISGIKQIGNILSEYFPVKPDDTNEISNRVKLT